MDSSVIQVTLAAANEAEAEKLQSCLERLVSEDSALRLVVDAETGQAIVGAMSEVQLEGAIDRLVFDLGARANIGKPQIAYRETVRTKAKAEGRFIRQGADYYGHCWIEMEPLPAGAGFKFENRVVDGSIPEDYFSGCEKGVHDGLNTGVLAGYPVVDVRVSLLSGSYHEVNSNEVAFRRAASIAFKDAMNQANPVLKEPIMHVVVTTPQASVGDVVADINSRGGRIEAMESAPQGERVVKSQMPLSRMLGYHRDLEGIGSGLAHFEITGSHFEEVVEPLGGPQQGA